MVALGGNALTRAGEAGTAEQIEANAEPMAAGIARLVEAGWRTVVVHGNGPQVGNLALQQDAGADVVPPQPLHSLGAMSQGQLGSVLVRAIDARLGAGRAVTVISHVVVDPDDPAFQRPTKPVGPFFSADRAAALARERGWTMVEDAGRGYRRVVPSPRPLQLLETAAVQRLLEAGLVVLTAGGGGIAVRRTPDGRILGVDAVIDKDAAAALVAAALSADALLLVTEVDAVSLDYGTPRQRPVRTMTVDEAAAHLDSGQFPPGSMGPKVQAAIDFVRRGGGTAAITNAAHLVEAPDAASPHGTRIVPSTVMSGA